MSKKKVRRKRKKQKNLFRIILIIAVLVYLLVMSIPMLRSSGAKTTPVKKANFVDSADAKGIVLKDETVYKARGRGNIVFSVKEGNKVSKDTKIAEMKNATQEDLTKKISEIDASILEYKNSLLSVEENKSEIEASIAEIEQYVRDGNDEGLNGVKEKIIVQSNEPEQTNKLISALRDKIELTNKATENSSIYNAEKAGIISKSLDGLEGKFTPEKIDQYKPKDLNIKQVNVKTTKDNQEVDNGTPIFKILEDQEWFILAEIKNNKLDDKKAGDTLSLSIDSSEERIQGTIYKLERHENNTFLIISLDRYLHELYKKRQIDLNITKDTYTGLEVPKESIVEKDGKKGVYIKDISGVVKFRQIKIVKNIKDISIVEPTGDTKALELFDEVFINANKIKEGQIVNYKGVD